MATKPAIALHVSLLYGSKGKQVTDCILQGYHATLRELTDYQLERACQREMRYGGEWPATADVLLAIGKGYRETAEAEQQRRLQNARHRQALLEHSKA